MTARKIGDKITIVDLYREENKVQFTTTTIKYVNRIYITADSNNCSYSKKKGYGTHLTYGHHNIVFFGELSPERKQEILNRQEEFIQPDARKYSKHTLELGPLYEIFKQYYKEDNK